jgi:Sec-independent protein secretion pathway component TatC
VPMGFLYEMSLYISKRVESKKSAELADAETNTT